MNNRPPEHINPNWLRPADPREWPYKEDWGSPAWEQRMAAVHARARELREKHGFLDCPSCKQMHTNKTVTCRECGFRRKIS